MANYNNFTAALANGRIAEEIVITSLINMNLEVTDVATNPDYYEAGIDLIVNNGMTIDVKNDNRCGSTGNVAVETMTNVGQNKLGWLYMCKASHIFFVDTTNEVVHCVRLSELKELVKHGTFKVVYTHQYECDKFYKEGEIVCVPINKLETLEHYVLLNYKTEE